MTSLDRRLCAFKNYGQILITFQKFVIIHISPIIHIMFSIIIQVFFQYIRYILVHMICQQSR